MVTLIISVTVGPQQGKLIPMIFIIFMLEVIFNNVLFNLAQNFIVKILLILIVFLFDALKIRST